MYINKNLSTYSNAGQIDKFLHKCTKTKFDSKGSVDYRIEDCKKKKRHIFL